ncbi:hypothetical protein ACIPV9_02015 [Pseudomonas psychrophila]|uniref:hypothetical protein n=1 Tax=Pseudomonas psychrophila TaxID=122355 RepID=UPI0037F80BEA
MIKLRSIKFFGMPNLGSELLDQIRDQPHQIKMFTTLELCAHLFDAFLSVTDEVSKSAQVIRLSKTTLMQFRGFLLVETDANVNYTEVIFRVAKPWLKGIGFDEATVIEVSLIGSADESIRVYLAGRRSQQALDYYEGWTAVSSDGHEMLIDLELARKQYGAKYADDFSNKIFRYLRKFKKSTALYKLSNIKFISDYMFHFLPAQEALDLLLDSGEVNAFFDHIKEVEELRVRSLGNNLPAFKKRWAQIVLVVYEFFVTYKVFAAPAYDLSKVIFVSGPELAQPTKQQLVAMITLMPLHISSDKVAAQVCRDITEDTLNIANVCEQVRQQTLALVNSRKKAANSYRDNLKTGFESKDDERFARYCYNWEIYNYSRLGKRNKYTLYEQESDLASKLGLLTGTTLIPLLYLLVYQHPQITPSWLIKFEMTGSNGQEYGVRDDGSFVVSEKSRMGFLNAQQVINLNPKSKSLFRDIQELTKQARAYLKSIGDDSWRYLLLGRHRGVSYPGRINKLDKFSENMHVTCPLTIALKKFCESDTRVVLSRIGLRPFRVNVAVMRFFESGDAYAMAEDLGHTGAGEDDLKEYLPLEIRQYFSSRRTRFFDNALIFESMQDSVYLVNALDFNTLEELDAFLKHYRLKPMPDSVSLRAFIQEYYSESAPANSSRAVIPVSPALCTTLITLADVFEECQARGETIKDAALNWFHVASLMRAVVNLHDSGQIAICSNEVISTFKAAKHLPELATKLRQLVVQSRSDSIC